MLSDLSLLFVEDDSVTREQFRKLFEDEFREFYLASNGREGLEIYRTHTPDIILTDLRMPELDGLEMVRAIRETDTTQVILVLSAHDDRETLIEMLNAPVDGFLVKPVFNISQVITRLEEAGEKVRHRKSIYQNRINLLYEQAHRDALTGLYNRYYFHKKLHSLMGETHSETSVALFFIDLDNFKTINDTYGHKTGDLVLKSVACRLTEQLPEKGILARIGGDEFSLLLPGIHSLRGVAGLASDLQQALNEPIRVGHDLEFVISCSIGISRYPEDALTADELIHHADLAMYRVKRSGKSGYSFYHSEKNRE